MRSIESLSWDEQLARFKARKRAREILMKMGFPMNAINDPVAIVEFFQDEKKVLEGLRRLKLEAFE